MSFVRTDPDALKKRLQTAGLWARKGLGQHFLIDEKILDQIIELSEIIPGERVVEIGPGPGALTKRLLDAGASLTAFEFDPGMVRLLREDFPNLEIQEGNILDIAPGVLENEYKVVANLPYNITNPVLRLFLEASG